MLRTLALALLVTLPLLSPAGADGTASASYVGTAGTLGSAHSLRCLDGVDVGAVCLDVPAGSGNATVTLDDDLATAVVGGGRVYNAAGGLLVEIPAFCDALAFRLPAGAATLQVYALLGTETSCAGAMAPTTGTITASFSA